MPLLDALERNTILKFIVSSKYVQAFTEHMHVVVNGTHAYT